MSNRQVSADLICILNRSGNLSGKPQILPKTPRSESVVDAAVGIELTFFLPWNPNKTTKAIDYFAEPNNVIKAPRIIRGSGGFPG
jgi:hypothetical protein